MSKKSLVTREKVELEEKPEEITTAIFEKPLSEAKAPISSVSIPEFLSDEPYPYFYHME